jgi:predicted metal-binding protein
MLSPVEPGPAIVVCSTCRVSAQMREDGEGRRGGTLLADALRAAQANSPDASAIAIQEMPCLFACQRHCAIHIRAPSRMGYVLGDFVPDADAAHAILDFAVRHAGSEEGVVPYGQWPDGVKGHFITRTPPEGFIVS